MRALVVLSRNGNSSVRSFLRHASLRMAMARIALGEPTSAFCGRCQPLFRIRLRNL
jgi:hypothetical protein